MKIFFCITQVHIFICYKIHVIGNALCKQVKCVWNDTSRFPLPWKYDTIIGYMKWCLCFPFSFYFLLSYLCVALTGWANMYLFSSYENFIMLKMDTRTCIIFINLEWWSWVLALICVETLSCVWTQGHIIILLK